MNLLKEALEMLGKCGKSTEDVRFVANSESWATWDEFSPIAALYDYDEGYGGAEVNPSLRVVGDDWWLERGEYDGSEWWEFKTLRPAPPEHNSHIDVTDRYA